MAFADIWSLKAQATLKAILGRHYWQRHAKIYKRIRDKGKHTERSICESRITIPEFVGGGWRVRSCDQAFVETAKCNASTKEIAL